MRLRHHARAGLVLAACLVTWVGASAARVAPAPATLPERLTDSEFWNLIDTFSEANGYFSSDNLVSNEDTFQYVIPELLQITKPAGVYLGVGPDQNFTYISALKPKMVFITDIRRGNLHAQLMYKTIFELATDRADFLSKLFSRPRPAGLGPMSTAIELFTAFASSAPSEALYAQNFQAIKDALTKHHKTPLLRADIDGVEFVFNSFCLAGPTLRYGPAGQSPFVLQNSRYPSYEDLQMTTDGHGKSSTYMASEANYKFLKAIEDRNMLVPLVGDFAGPKALRAVAGYLKEHSATVTAFYTSNVEQYLFQYGIWNAFASNVSTLPLDESSTFIRSCFNLCQSPSGARAVQLLDSIPVLLKDAAEGRIRSYQDVLNHSR